MHRMPTILIMLLCLSCGETDEKTTRPEEDTSATDSGQQVVPRADCDVPIDGVDWGSSPVLDHAPGIAETIEAADLSVLDDEIDISTLAAVYRGGIAYALEIAPTELPSSLNKADVLAKGYLGQVVLASLSQSVGNMDYTLFRQGLQRYYTCSKRFPLTLEDFEQVYGEIPEEYTLIDSKAKCNPRRLRLSPETGVYAAESMADGTLRETEILLTANRSDGQLDFVVYDADGMLTDRSQFPTLGGGPHLVAASPYVCMSCHLNADAAPDTWGYDLLLPTTGPCAR